MHPSHVACKFMYASMITQMDFLFRKRAYEMLLINWQQFITIQMQFLYAKKFALHLSSIKNKTVLSVFFGGFLHLHLAGKLVILIFVLDIME